MIKREDIIGQDILLDRFDKMIDSNTLPQFIVISGYYGIGKRLIATYIADKLGYTLYQSRDGRVHTEYVREIAKLAYTQTEPTVYLLPNMNNASKMAIEMLLKVTEEPPKNAYFIITCSWITKLPITIRSRCKEFSLRKYSYDDLINIAHKHYPEVNTDTVASIIHNVDTPGVMLTQLQVIEDTKSLNEFAIKVVDNIGTASEANVFKIAEKLSFSENDSKGYRLMAFYTAFSNECMQRTKDISKPDRNMYFKWIRTTGAYRDKLNNIALNKRTMFDLWIVEIKEIYDDYHRERKAYGN